MQPACLRVLHIDNLNLEYVGPHEPPVTLPELEEINVTNTRLMSLEATNALTMLLQHTTRLQKLLAETVELDDSYRQIPAVPSFTWLLHKRIDLSRLTLLSVRSTCFVVVVGFYFCSLVSFVFHIPFCVTTPG